ncbi:MAG: hypothetical protein BWY45_03546 [Euryarchaeota archaeon ADurb.Bin294]|nr:MAG: hypothetical protein BWY45_03546 [Euryarchaeota archaeon ADurb.Bin294]
MTVTMNNFVLTFMGYFDTEDGRAYLREIFDEVVDNYLKENPDHTREDVLSCFKSIN